MDMQMMKLILDMLEGMTGASITAVYVIFGYYAFSTLIVAGSILIVSFLLARIWSEHLHNSTGEEQGKATNRLREVRDVMHIGLDGPVTNEEFSCIIRTVSDHRQEMSLLKSRYDSVSLDYQTLQLIQKQHITTNSGEKKK